MSNRELIDKLRRNPRGVMFQLEHECADALEKAEAELEATLWRHGEKVLAEALAGFEGKPSAISDERDYKALYLDLIMQVAKKYPGETRHDTAKKYIRFCETPIGEGRDQAAAQEGK